MPAHSLHTRGATLIATTCCFALSSRQRDGGWDVTTFSRFFRCMGTTHPCLLTSAGKPAEIFFGWPLTKAFGGAGPFRTSTLFRIAVGGHIPYSVRSTRDSLL